MAKKFYSIVANIRGKSAEAVFKSILDNHEVSGLRGPTISKVYTEDKENWYAVNIVVENNKLFRTIDHLRKNKGEGILVFPIEYIFGDRSYYYNELERKLKKTK